MQELPFSDKSFDLVVANHMLYHVPDPLRAFREIRRVLRPDGTALIATNGMGHMRQLFDAVDDLVGGRAQLLGQSFGIEVGEALLRQVFGTITWHSFMNPLLVTDPNDLLAYATSFPPGENATVGQRATMLERFTAEVADGAGGLRIDTRAGAFVCSGVGI